MRVLLSTYGSRGDVEPMAALGAALQALGAEAVVSAPPDQDFVDLLDRARVKLAPAFFSVRQWIRERKKPADAADFNRLANEMMAAQIVSIAETAQGCDAIVATGLNPSVAAAKAVSEKKGLRFVATVYCPLFLPSHHHAPFNYPQHPLPPDVTDNRKLWELNADVTNRLFGEATNAQRAAVGLQPVSNVREHLFGDRLFLASDPVLWPWLPTDLSNAVQTGAWILPDERPLPAELEAFLQAGEPPVYVGFGSIAVPQETARACIAAIRAHGRRAIVHRGWADLGLIDDQPDCFAIGEVNQQALFKRVAAVVHHGGAGTTTTAARAGAPQIIVPQIVDQPYWAARVAGLGIGIAHEGPTPTFESLSAALKTALSAGVRARATEVARKVRGDGAMVAARMLVERT